MSKANIDKIFKIMTETKYAMLTTIGNIPMARPMALVSKEVGNKLHFFTVIDMNIVEDALKSSDVLVTFSDRSSMNFVSVLGEASINQNPKDMKKHFNFTDNAYFKDGLYTDGLCLLEVDIDHIECWSSNKNFFMTGLEILTHLGKGRRADLTERISINM